MLRRKLLVRVGLLIGGFVAGAVVAVWLLQGALTAIDRSSQDAEILIGGIQAVGTAATRIEAERAGAGEPALAASDAPDLLNAAMARIGAHPATRDRGSGAGAAYERLSRLIPGFLGQAPDEGGKRSAPNLTSTVALHGAVQDLGVSLRTYVAAEQSSLGRYFRSLVLGLTLAALVMVNVAVVVLLSTAQMVLRPVAALVEGSRQLAEEHFDHRVTVGQADEFGELAHAYNRLAEKLQANEERKAETLRQLAVMLNHDLNNAMTVIELQLGLMDRQAGDNPVFAGHLRDIRATLARMSGTVASLKNIRRIVLTDYGPGQKMLDLERSVAPGPAPSTPSGHAA